MKIFGEQKPRTEKEQKICHKIVKYTNILGRDNGEHREGYERVKKRRAELYRDLERICKGDRNRYDENIFYIKSLVKQLPSPEKTTISGHVGLIGAKFEKDTRPNQPD